MRIARSIQQDAEIGPGDWHEHCGSKFQPRQLLPEFRVARPGALDKYRGPGRIYIRKDGFELTREGAPARGLDLQGRALLRQVITRMQAAQVAADRAGDELKQP